MALTSTTIRIAYTGNGSTTAFATGFYFLEASHLLVYVSDSLKTLGSDYTVTGAGNPSGGTVTFLAAPALGASVLIVRQTPLTQEVDYVTGDAFPAETHERALDKLTMQAQELRSPGGVTDRALRYPISEPSGYVADIPAKAARSGKLLGFDLDGKPVATSPSAVGPESIGTAELKAESVTLGKIAASALASLRDRATHTGTQIAATISDFAAAALSAVTWSTLTGKPSTFPPSAHTHPPSDLTAGGASTGQFLAWNGTAWAPATVAGQPNYIRLQDEQPPGTAGQSYTAGTWVTCRLNTEAEDAGGHCSLASDLFTLAAGTYRVRARIAIYSISTIGVKVRLQNFTDSTVLLVGDTSRSASYVSTRTEVAGTFVLTSSKQLGMQLYVGTELTPLPAVNVSATNEIYNVVELWKLS